MLNNAHVSLAQTKKIADWIYTSTGARVTNIQDGYFLNGTPLTPGNDFTTFFAAPFGVAAMTRPAYQSFLNAIYDAVKQRHEDYYEDSVTMLCLLVLTGNYWDPAVNHNSKILLPACPCFINKTSSTRTEKLMKQ